MSDLLIDHGGDWLTVTINRPAKRNALDGVTIAALSEAFETLRAQDDVRLVVLRGAGSTFDTILPIGKKRNVGMINWGFVNGKTQTDMPWDSWQRPYTLRPPTLWFHDIFRLDGSPFDAKEVEYIKRVTKAGRP